jgi:hypothetical protein
MRPFSFLIGLFLLALLLAIFGIGVAIDVRPMLVSRAVHTVLNPWSIEWNKAPALTVECPSPITSNIRMVTVRALREPNDFAFLFEWPDSSPDLSFEGASYPRALTSPVSKAQESTLLRDELIVWIGGASSTGAQNAVLNALHENGFWIWRSQWQRDKDRHLISEVRAKYGKPFVEFYPVQWEGAYPARFVGNTNAIMGASSSCQWIVRPARDVYTPPVTRKIEGEGHWQGGRWRVMFRVPSAELEKLGNPLSMIFSVVDGGLAERKHLRIISSPLRLDLRMAIQNLGGTGI